MNIGIDFDNTIVSYDRVFHHHAARLGHIPPHTAMSKREIRDLIRILPDGESKWIELQGLVYGHHIDEASFAPGVHGFFRRCTEHSVRVFIISHKTRYPALGPRYDLREAAARWIEQKGLTSDFGLSLSDCFFTDTLEEKLARVSANRCAYFIDDLVEVLAHPAFPGESKKILYSVMPLPNLPGDIVQFGSWDAIRAFVFGG